MFGPKAPFSHKRARVAYIVGEYQYILHGGGPFVYTEDNLSAVNNSHYYNGRRPGYIPVRPEDGGKGGQPRLYTRSKGHEDTSDDAPAEEGDLRTGEGPDVEEGSADHSAS